MGLKFKERVCGKIHATAFNPLFFLAPSILASF